MSTYRKIAHVLPAESVDMGGMTVKEPLPHANLQDLDPFLLLHHHGPTEISPGGSQEDAGVPPHPHRGFDPVTFIYQGGIHHRDSMGNDSVVRAGGVQWTSAGEGLIHSERPPQDLMENGGTQEIIQLWINVPSARRMAPPRYQALHQADIPILKKADGRVEIQVVAGPQNGIEGPAETRSPITALNARFARGSTVDISLPDKHNAFIYLLDGRLRLQHQREIEGEHMVVLQDSGDLHVEARDDTRALIMTGKPLGEAYVSSGPFVVDESADIYRAMKDYEQGRMGELIEEFE